MNTVWRNSILAGFFMVSCTATQAGVIVGGTRLIYKDDKKETSISVSNSENLAYLVQSWVDAENENNTAQPPFIVTPPLFRLDENAENILRVIMVRDELPKDKESLFWLNIKSIPSVEKVDNSLQIAIKTRIKLIYRPKGITDSLEDAAGRLEWTRQGKSLKVLNNSPYYITFYSLDVGGKKIEETTMLSPQSTTQYITPVGISGKTINWTIINDSGGVSEKYQSKF